MGHIFLSSGGEAAAATTTAAAHSSGRWCEGDSSLTLRTVGGRPLRPRRPNRMLGGNARFGWVRSCVSLLLWPPLGQVELVRVGEARRGSTDPKQELLPG